MKISLPIEGHFHLSLVRRGDEAAFLEHLAEPEISKNLLAVPHPYLPAHADWWVSHCEQILNPKVANFAVRSSSGYLVGQIGLVGLWSPGEQIAEFGYWLARPYWGRGLMPASIQAFAEHVISTLSVRCLFATPFASNHASHRALENAGFERECLLPAYHLKDEQQIDAIRYVRFHQTQIPR